MRCPQPECEGKEALAFIYKVQIIEFDKDGLVHAYYENRSVYMCEECHQRFYV